MKTSHLGLSAPKSPHSLYVVQFCFSVVILIYPNKKLLCCGLRKALLYRSKQNIIMSHFIVLFLQQNNRMKVFSQARDLSSWPLQLGQGWFPSHGVCHKSNSEVVGCSHNICATIKSVYLAGRSLLQVTRITVFLLQLHTEYLLAP